MEDKREGMADNTEAIAVNTETAAEQKDTNEKKKPNKTIIMIVCGVVAVLLCWTILMRVNVKGNWVRDGINYSAKYGCYTTVIESFAKENGKTYVTITFDQSTGQALNIEYGTWNYSLLRVITHEDGKKNHTSNLWYIPILNKLYNNQLYVLKKWKAD